MYYNRWNMRAFVINPRTDAPARLMWTRWAGTWKDLTNGAFSVRNWGASRLTLPLCVACLFRFKLIDGQ